MASRQLLEDTHLHMQISALTTAVSSEHVTLGQRSRFRKKFFLDKSLILISMEKSRPNYLKCYLLFPWLCHCCVQWQLSFCFAAEAFNCMRQKLMSKPGRPGNPFHTEPQKQVHNCCHRNRDHRYNAILWWTWVGANKAVCSSAFRNSKLRLIASWVETVTTFRKNRNASDMERSGSECKAHYLAAIYEPTV
jgi:hypothetical protein